MKFKKIETNTPRNINLENTISSLNLQLVLPNGMYLFFPLVALFFKSLLFQTAICPISSKLDCYICLNRFTSNKNTASCTDFFLHISTNIGSNF